MVELVARAALHQVLHEICAATIKLSVANHVVIFHRLVLDITLLHPYTFA